MKYRTILTAILLAALSGSAIAQSNGTDITYNPVDLPKGQKTNITYHLTSDNPISLPKGQKTNAAHRIEKDICAHWTAKCRR